MILQHTGTSPLHDYSLCRLVFSDSLILLEVTGSATIYIFYLCVKLGNSVQGNQTVNGVQAFLSCGDWLKVCCWVSDGQR